MRLSPCHRPPRHLYSAEGGCRSEARRLAAGQAGCLPAEEVTGSAAGLAHPWDRSMLSQEGNKLSGQGYHAQGQAIPCQDSSSHGPRKGLLLATRPRTQRKAKETVCGVAPHLGASQPPGSLSLPSSLEAAVHVPLILQQWHQ